MVYAYCMSFFDWDESNIEHVGEHDVTPKEVFNRDPEFAYRFTQDGERYYRAYGFTAHGRYLTVGYVERGHKIRPVTAWDMTREERKVYDAKKIDQQE
jgi:uncharacterized DUF497 family protein